jgi:hypothetical protein
MRFGFGVSAISRADKTMIVDRFVLLAYREPSTLIRFVA